MILFSDFDRTLYFRDSDDSTMRNLRAVEEWRSAGNLFCVTTGRSYKSVTTQMPQIKKLCDYFIVDGGSCEYAIKKEKQEVAKNIRLMSKNHTFRSAECRV